MLFEEACGFTVHGPDPNKPISSRLDNTQMAASMYYAIKKYNLQAEAENVRRVAANAEIAERLRSGELDAECALALKQQLMKIVKTVPDKNWVLRFKRQYGWGDTRLNQAGGTFYFSIDHEKMRAQRDTFKRRVCFLQTVCFFCLFDCLM